MGNGYSDPAFNLSLCEKFGLKPLEFDGRRILFHEFDQAGNKHMEYVEDRGPFLDVPFQQILTTFKEIYNPVILLVQADFHAEGPDSLTGDKQAEMAPHPKMVNQQI